VVQQLANGLGITMSSLIIDLEAEVAAGEGQE
jgi:hypothetical protein